MKRAIIWGFLFVILVLLTAQAIDSNRDELTRSYPLRISLPFIGTYQTTVAPTAASYFVICLLLGGFVVMAFSLRAVMRANRLARLAQQEAEELRIELARLRGPAEDDEVYAAPMSPEDLE